MEPSNDVFREPSQVVEFWRTAGPTRWFRKSEDFDREFCARCLSLHERAATGQLEDWTSSAEGALALVLLLDQFPRNAFRDTPRMFASDVLARRYADLALQAGFDGQVDAALRFFFYMPFEHSEQLEDQKRSMALHEAIGFTEYAALHHDIIQRFGRFPHRNRLLGRETTPDEQAFLDAGGFRG
jgi:uncharacterized protein (DUF924 family)